ncbi:protein beta isoform-like isoform x2 protein [Lasius niger]|uniref:Protein beta isoform-like isoform x2 protein n=1 Tax=Lasius niger TaxID=67767 RepID=A0A0J7KNW2_LASNI|nr:protein beta isoform-like isoform x2 protein [Lasius niger]
MNMHKGTTQCPVCHKVLSRTTHMKRHLKNRHGWHGGVGTTATATAAAGMASAGGVETPAPISVSSTAQAIAQQNAGSPSNIDANATYTTIRIRESSVERITSSPIP